MYSARLEAWVPMSPMQPAAPAALGSVRHDGLLLAGGFEPVGEPALRVLDDDLADLAELAARATRSRASFTIG